MSQDNKSAVAAGDKQSAVAAGLAHGVDSEYPAGIKGGRFSEY
jgi:hypothetical protein